MMLYANMEDRAEILAEATVSRLIRESFKIWELAALQKKYTRQRQIVESETALGIRGVQRCIHFWKMKAKLKRRQEDCQIQKSTYEYNP